jgi:hypothetical protein
MKMKPKWNFILIVGLFVLELVVVLCDHTTCLCTNCEVNIKI